MENKNNKWKFLIISFLVVMLFSDALVLLWGKRNIEILTKIHKEKISNEVKIFQKKIDESINISSTNITQKIKDKSDSIIEESLLEYRNKLNKIKEEIKIEENELEKISSKRKREKKGLPELVELSDLRKYYAGKFRGKNNYEIVEDFETAKGNISFMLSDFDYEVIESSDELAWLRIGKKASQTNSELIKSWLKTSRKIKTKLGYKKIYKKTKPSDYGKYTEVYLKKGDMYFKTYYQHERILESYSRHSLQYTFYVEIGSVSRKEKVRIEKYNKSLGS